MGTKQRYGINNIICVDFSIKILKLKIEKLFCYYYANGSVFCFVSHYGLLPRHIAEKMFVTFFIPITSDLKLHCRSLRLTKIDTRGYIYIYTREHLR